MEPSKAAVSRKRAKAAEKQKSTDEEGVDEVEDITSSEAMEVAEGQKAPRMVCSAPHLIELEDREKEDVDDYFVDITQTAERKRER